MALGTGVLVVSAPSGSGQPATGTFGALKTSAAKILGGESQAKIKELAGDGILRGIDDLNMKHLFRFGSKQSADTALVSGTATYSLASDFFAVQEVQLIDTNSKTHTTLEYIPWGQFNALEPQQTSTGRPIYWTSRNTFDDGTITLYPTPDASAAANYTYRITYYERIARPSLDDDIISAPRELQEILVTYAEYHLLMLRSRNNPYAIEAKWQEYERKRQQFVESTEREPSANLQWVMGVDVRSGDSQYDPLS